MRHSLSQVDVTSADSGITPKFFFKQFSPPVRQAHVFDDIVGVIMIIPIISQLSPDAPLVSRSNLEVPVDHPMAPLTAPWIGS